MDHVTICTVKHSKVFFVKFVLLRNIFFELQVGENGEGKVKYFLLSLSPLSPNSIVLICPIFFAFFCH